MKGVGASVIKSGRGVELQRTTRQGQNLQRQLEFDSKRKLAPSSTLACPRWPKLQSIRTMSPLPSTCTRSHTHSRTRENKPFVSSCKARGVDLFDMVTNLFIVCLQIHGCEVKSPDEQIARSQQVQLTHLSLIGSEKKAQPQICNKVLFAPWSRATAANGVRVGQRLSTYLGTSRACHIQQRPLYASVPQWPFCAVSNFLQLVQYSPQLPVVRQRQLQLSIFLTVM
jgi:hypothetical protein